MLTLIMLLPLCACASQSLDAGTQEAKTEEKKTKEEAEKAALFLRRVKKLEAYATDGIEPNRPLFRAFSSGKAVVKAIFEEKLRGLG